MHVHCSSAHWLQPGVALHGTGQPSKTSGMQSSSLHTLTQQSIESQPSAQNAPM
jgi:hypothetical protein